MQVCVIFWLKLLKLPFCLFQGSRHNSTEQRSFDLSCKREFDDSFHNFKDVFQSRVNLILTRILYTMYDVSASK